MKVALLSLTILLVIGNIDRSQAGEISGIPRIVDGDTVQIGETKIRLQGIDAPETDQLCLDPKGNSWACGLASRDELIRHSAGQSWDCDLTGADRYSRSLGTCFIEGENVNAWMVRQGWALSFVRYSRAYGADEVAARNAHAGIWKGALIAPRVSEMALPAEPRQKLVQPDVIVT